MAIDEGRNADWLVNRELRLSAQLSLHHDRPIQWPHYCGCCNNPPVSLVLHPSLTREQHPKIFFHLRQGLSPNPDGVVHLFPVENHGLGLGGADSHPSLVTLEIMSIKIMNRTSDKGQPCWSPTCTGNRSDSLPAMRTKLLLRSYIDCTALSRGPPTCTPRAPPTECHMGHGRMPSPSPQSTCGLVGANSHDPSSTLQRVQSWSSVPRPGQKPHCSSWIRVWLSAEFSSPVPWNRLSRSWGVWSPNSWNTPFGPPFWIGGPPPWSASPEALSPTTKRCCREVSTKTSPMTTFRHEINKPNVSQYYSCTSSQRAIGQLGIVKNLTIRFLLFGSQFDSLLI